MVSASTRGSCRDEAREQSLAKLDRPRDGVVADDAVVVDPTHATLDNDPLVVDRLEGVGRSLVEALAEVLLDEADEVRPSFDDEAGSQLRDEKHVVVNEVAEMLERSLPNRREPALGEPFALEVVALLAFDGEEYARQRERRPGSRFATG